MNEITSLSEDDEREISDLVDSLSVMSSMFGYEFEFFRNKKDIDITLTKIIKSGIFKFHSEYRLTFFLAENSNGTNRISVIKLNYAPTQLSIYENLGTAKVIRYKNGKVSKPIQTLINRLGKDDYE